MKAIENGSGGIRAQGVRRVADLRLRGPAGTTPVRVRWPRSPASEPAPPLVLLFPDAATADGVDHADEELAVEICSRVGAVVLCTPWAPRKAGALDRAEAALMWVADHGDELGADPSRLAVAGRGAGAAAAAALALRARERGWPQIRHQALVVTDADLDDVEALTKPLRDALFEPQEG